METYQAKRQLGFTDNDTIEITIAPNAGACFGVVRAIKLGHQALARKQTKNVYSFGPLIHNPKVVDELTAGGIQIVSNTSEIPTGTVILRSHGVQKEVESDLKERGIRIIDATCPLVKKPQRIAASLGEQGHFLVIVGDKNHPEVKGVLSYFGRPDFLITYDSDDVASIPDQTEKVGVIAQTTIEVAVLNRVVEALKSRFNDVSVFNTICDATSIRQNEAVALAENADVVIVVGGKNSSNTCKLVKICEALQENTHHIEDVSEILPGWFEGKRKIGITGGASTPHEFVDSVGNHVVQMLQPPTH